MSAVPRLAPPAMRGPSGVQLSPEHVDHLHSGSGISPEIIAERGYVTVTSATQLAHMARSQRRVPGIGIPVYRLGELYTTMLRPDEPRRETNDDGKEKILKYEWPAQTGLVLDMLPRYRAALQDIAVPICITEGIKKTDAAASQAWGANAVWISINGVWGWMDGKDADGNRYLHADYRQIPLRGRRVILIPDSDYEVNPQVQMAFDEHAKVLTARGAEVGIVRFPHGDKKMGLDDAIVDGWAWAEILQATHWCDGQPGNDSFPQGGEIQRLQRDVERLQAHIQQIEATFGNKELPASERLTLYYTVKELNAQRRKHPPAEPQAPVLARVWKIAEESGQKESAVGRHLKNFEQYGVLQRDIRRQHDSSTKQVKTELYILPSPELDRPFHIKPNAPKNWGGRRERCAACGSENLIERVTIACEDCGTIHKTTERRLHPPIIQDERSDEQWQAETNDNTSTPITYIAHFDGSARRSSSCQTSPIVQDEGSGQPPNHRPQTDPFVAEAQHYLDCKHWKLARLTAGYIRCPEVRERVLSTIEQRTGAGDAA